MKKLILLIICILSVGIAYAAECSTLLTDDCTITNSLYTMSANLSCADSGTNGCIIMGDNGRLDCNGFYIIGTNLSNSRGIFSTAFNNTIINCNVKNYNYNLRGIFKNATLNNINVSNGYGWYIASSGFIDNTTARNINFNNATLYMQKASNLTLINFSFNCLNSSCAGTGNVTYMEDSNNVSFYNLTILNATQGYYSITSNSTIIDGCRMAGNGISNLYGIYQQSNRLNIINNCNVSGFFSNYFYVLSNNSNLTNSIASYENGDTGNVYYLNSNNIIMNNVTSNHALGVHGNHGLYIASDYASTSPAENYTVINSYFFNDSSSGVHINSKYADNRVTNLNLSNNVMDSNGEGMTDMGCELCYIYNNTFVNNVDGVLLQEDPVYQNGSNSSRYFNNTFVNYTYSAFTVSSGSQNITILNNYYLTNPISYIRWNVSHSPTTFILNESTNQFYTLYYDSLYNTVHHVYLYLNYTGSKQVSVTNSTVNLYSLSSPLFSGLLYSNSTIYGLNASLSLKPNSQVVIQ